MMLPSEKTHPNRNCGLTNRSATSSLMVLAGGGGGRFGIETGTPSLRTISRTPVKGSSFPTGAAFPSDVGCVPARCLRASSAAKLDERLSLSPSGLPRIRTAFTVPTSGRRKRAAPAPKPEVAGKTNSSSDAERSIMWASSFASSAFMVTARAHARGSPRRAPAMTVHRAPRAPRASPPRCCAPVPIVTDELLIPGLDGPPVRMCRASSIEPLTADFLQRLPTRSPADPG
eukprot:7102084-Prymnesium_polylepis.1